MPLHRELCLASTYLLKAGAGEKGDEATSDELLAGVLDIADANGLGATSRDLAEVIPDAFPSAAVVVGVLANVVKHRNRLVWPPKCAAFLTEEQRTRLADLQDNRISRATLAETSGAPAKN